ncbi:hypothetical protein VPH35_122188 [Triticum aestivum]
MRPIHPHPAFCSSSLSATGKGPIKRRRRAGQQVPLPHDRTTAKARSHQERIMRSPACLAAALLLLALRLPAPAVAGRPLVARDRKPAPSEAAATARWLAAQNTWGVLSTISSDLSGAPFGNVVSYSDGVPGESHGIPYFYLTTLDPTARDALEDERTSFTLSEFPLGTCGKVDPENPTCAKLTLTGKVITTYIHHKMIVHFLYFPAAYICLTLA